MEPKRSNWYMLTALILGLIIGLVYTWVISPASRVDTHPAALRADYKDIYRALIARAYQANANLPRAKARLALLEDEAPALELAAQAQRFLADEGDVETAKLLANLSAALQSAQVLSEEEPEPTTQPTDTLLAATITPSITLEPDQTAVQTSTPTPEPTEAPPFVLLDATAICDPTLGDSLIQVFATNAEGDGIPGVPITITWGLDQEETFFTGLKPEIGLGYADFEADPGELYDLSTADSGILVSEMEIPSCENAEGDSYWGSWEIYLTHPN